MRESYTCILERTVYPAPAMLWNYNLYCCYDHDQHNEYSDVFSISVTIKDFSKEESVFVNDVTRIKEKAVNVFNTLADSKVSIYAVKDMIEDLMYQ